MHNDWLCFLILKVNVLSERTLTIDLSGLDLTEWSVLALRFTFSDIGQVYLDLNDLDLRKWMVILELVIGNQH